VQKAAILSADVTEKEKDVLTSLVREGVVYYMESTDIVSELNYVQRGTTNVTVATMETTRMTMRTDDSGLSKGESLTPLTFVHI
jgi:hypothetical protein